MFTAERRRPHDWQMPFPVAGYGTRFLPATKSMPKEMLPVVNKPLCSMALRKRSRRHDQLRWSRAQRAIADHFDISYELDTDFDPRSNI